MDTGISKPSPKEESESQPMSTSETAGKSLPATSKDETETQPSSNVSAISEEQDLPQTKQDNDSKTTLPEEQTSKMSQASSGNQNPVNIKEPLSEREYPSVTDTFEVADRAAVPGQDAAMQSQGDTTEVIRKQGTSKSEKLQCIEVQQESREELEKENTSEQSSGVSEESSTGGAEKITNKEQPMSSETFKGEAPSGASKPAVDVLSRREVVDVEKEASDKYIYISDPPQAASKEAHIETAQQQPTVLGSSSPDASSLVKNVAGNVIGKGGTADTKQQVVTAGNGLNEGIAEDEVSDQTQSAAKKVEEEAADKDLSDPPQAASKEVHVETAQQHPPVSGSWSSAASSLVKNIVENMIAKGGTTNAKKQVVTVGNANPTAKGGILNTPKQIGAVVNANALTGMMKSTLPGGKSVCYVNLGRKLLPGQQIHIPGTSGSQKQFFSLGKPSETGNVKQAPTGGKSRNETQAVKKHKKTGNVERFVSKRHTKPVDNNELGDHADTSLASSSHDHDYSQQCDLARSKPLRKTTGIQRKRDRRIRKCVVEKCNSNAESFPDLKFFRFPVRDEARFATWARVVGKPDYVGARRGGRKHFGFVCALHFEDKDLGTARARNSAVPTLELPEGDTPENRYLIGGELKIKPGVLSSLTKKENAKPTFINPLKDYTEKFSTKVALQCLINLDAADVVWYHNGERIKPCKHFMVKFDVRSAKIKQNTDFLFRIGVVTLIIPNPSVQDSGLYMCQASKNGKHSVCCAYLTVFGRTYKCEDQDPHAAQVPETQCRKCHLKIHPPDLGKRLLDEVLPQMKVDMVKEMKVPSPVPTATYTTGKIPRFAIRLKNTSTSLGSSVVMRCMYDDTEASARWYHNGKRLGVCKHYDTLMSTTEDRRYAVLRVMPITEEDFGTYTCVAISKKTMLASSTSCIVSCEEEEDEGGNDVEPVVPNTKEADECKKCIRGVKPPEAPLVHDEVFHRLQKEVAKIKGAPSVSDRKIRVEGPKFLKELSDVSVMYGERLMLTAMIDDPFASVSWYHKGDILGTCKHTEMVLSTSSKRRYAVLRINPAMDADAGIYTCVATGGTAKKASSSACTVTVEGTSTGALEDYGDMVCDKCVTDPTDPGRQRVFYTEAARAAREGLPEPPEKVAAASKYRTQEPTMPTIQSAWSISTSAPAEFSTPDRNVNKRKASFDDDLPPPPDTPPRSPSPPLPTHDNDLPPLFVQKLVDVRSTQRVFKSVMLTCVVNVQSAKHDWYHNGRKILPCKDYNIKRAVDKKNISSSQMIAMLEIEDIDKSDFGVYTCVASNSQGSISTSCFVGSHKISETMDNWPVLECEKCKHAVKRKSKKRKHKEGSSKEEKDKTNVPSTSGTENQNNTGDQEAPNVDQTQGNSIGEETSTATVAEGSQEEDSEQQQPDIKTVVHNAQSHHIKPLVVTRELIGIKDIVERTINLKCRFSRSVPTIKWFYMGHEIKECSHYCPQLDIVDGEARASLKLCKLAPVDLGIYTCVAYTSKDPFVSTSCNLTARSKPMYDYLKACNKCIVRKVERANTYEALKKKRRKLVELQVDENEHIGAVEDMETNHTQPAVLDPLHSYSRPSTDQAVLRTLLERPSTVQAKFKTSTGDEHKKQVVLISTPPTLSTKQASRQVLKEEQEFSIRKDQETQITTSATTSDGFLWHTRPTTKALLADSLRENKEHEERKRREQMIMQANADLRRKVRNFQQILRRQTEKYEMQLKGQIPNKHKSSKSTQTNKKIDPLAEHDKLEKRYKEIQRKLSAVNGRYGNAVREVAKLHNVRKSQQQNHDETVAKLKERIAELEASLQRRDASQLGRQLQSRGKDPNTFAGFIQYMSEPSQEY